MGDSHEYIQSFYVWVFLLAAMGCDASVQNTPEDPEDSDNLT